MADAGAVSEEQAHAEEEETPRGLMVNLAAGYDDPIQGIYEALLVAEAIFHAVQGGWEETFPAMRERDAKSSPGRLKSALGTIDRLKKSIKRYERDMARAAEAGSTEEEKAE